MSWSSNAKCFGPGCTVSIAGRSHNARYCSQRCKLARRHELRIKRYKNVCAQCVSQRCHHLTKVARERSGDDVNRVVQVQLERKGELQRDREPPAARAGAPTEPPLTRNRRGSAGAERQRSRTTSNGRNQAFGRKLTGAEAKAAQAIFDRACPKCRARLGQSCSYAGRRVPTHSERIVERPRSPR
jgi:hypothetical protein